jgi:segregation and condensation protein B
MTEPTSAAEDSNEQSQGEDVSATAPTPVCETDASVDAVAEAEEKVAALEAVLFMAADPLPVSEVADILDVPMADAEALLARLESECVGRGVQVTRIAGGYQLSTRPEYGPSVAKLHKPERFRLSRAALETLAIVAYKQPATRPEVEAIRGVNSDSPLDTLCQYGLVCEAGRKEAPGRPVLYRTTDNFLGQFGLNSVEDLPSLDSVPADEGDAAQVSEEGAADPGAPVAKAPPESDGEGAAQREVLATEPAPPVSGDRAAEQHWSDSEATSEDVTEQADT